MDSWIIGIGKSYRGSPTDTLDEAQASFKAAMADWRRILAKRQRLNKQKAHLKIIANRVWMERDQLGVQSDRLKASYYRLWAERYRLKMEQSSLTAGGCRRWAEWQESHGLAVVSRLEKLHLIAGTDAGELLGPVLEGW